MPTRGVAHPGCGTRRPAVGVDIVLSGKTEIDADAGMVVWTRPSRTRVDSSFLRWSGSSTTIRPRRTTGARWWMTSGSGPGTECWIRHLVQDSGAACSRRRSIPAAASSLSTSPLSCSATRGRPLGEDPLEDVIDLVLGEFSRLPFDGGTFDVAFLGNCFCYVADIPAVLKRHKDVTRAGGRVISKEFDGGAVIFHPVDATLTLKVVTGAAQALAGRTGSSRFDNFVGRKMHGMFLQAGFTVVSTRSYAIQKLFPLSPAMTRYIRSNAEWYGRMALPYLSDEEQCQWANAFDLDSDACVLDRPDFYFSMIETVTEGTV